MNDRTERCAQCGQAWPCIEARILIRADELLATAVKWPEAQVTARDEISAAS